MRSCIFCHPKAVYSKLRSLVLSVIVQQDRWTIPLNGFFTVTVSPLTRLLPPLYREGVSR
jgi:hypothetical protein